MCDAALQGLTGRAAERGPRTRGDDETTPTHTQQSAAKRSKAPGTASRPALPSVTSLSSGGSPVPFTSVPLGSLRLPSAAHHAAGESRHTRSGRSRVQEPRERGAKASSPRSGLGPRLRQVRLAGPFGPCCPLVVPRTMASAANTSRQDTGERESRRERGKDLLGAATPRALAKARCGGTA